MAVFRRDSLATRQLLRLVLLHTAWEVGSGQVRYSVPEESKHGTFVGRLAQDLGLEVAELVSRMFRMVSSGRRDYFEPVYTVFVRENNPPGAHLLTVSASDPDLRENAFVSYSVVERSVGEQPLSSYISVHSESGHIYALQPLDYEELQVLQFQVSARDAGLPSLCGNVTVQLFVLDANDNAPAVSPAGSVRGSPGPELVPLSAGAGHVVGKIRAVDADSGYNAWLRYEVQEPGAAGPFRVGMYSGEISTTRALEEADGPSQRLVILVKDHGEPALSATATVSLSLVESPQAVKWDSRPRGGSEGPLVDMNVSLMIAICSVSGLFVLVIVVYVGLRCHQGPAVMCGPGKATVVCASEVGSWSYSQRQSRNLCVGEGTAKNDLMVFSPNFPNCAEKSGTVKEQELAPNSSGQLIRQPGYFLHGALWVWLWEAHNEIDSD
ncbi:protocadherin alpha-13-like [Gopherus flavomarginatus]|uniref:protocadherin alpha-13-like n=1 Tax=Gopherus flavomarginatus TaxID=286002 RepID=UPI0021CC4C7E|nr:protocadherin alpha-13-like [Gopherus flavomarginatus]